jgi:aspartate/methionine/tyrosine aminotransferase
MDIALELNSLSKSHNMAGWRMGAVLGRADYLSAILRFKSNMDSGQFLPAQMAAAAALSLPETWYEDLNQVYAERRETALQLLRHTGARVTPGQQGLFLWAKAPAAWEDGYAMSDHYLRHGRVFFTPGGIFGEAGRPYIRLSLCQPVAVMREAIERCMLIQPEGTHSKP